MKSRFEKYFYNNIPELSPFEVDIRPLNTPITLEGDHEDIMRRKQLSIVAMNNMEKVWIRKYHISETHRLNLYRTLVKPVKLGTNETRRSKY